MKEKTKERLLDIIPKHGIHGGVDHRDWSFRAGMMPESRKAQVKDRQEWEEKWNRIDWTKK
jgi:hypothetical protein